TNNINLYAVWTPTTVAEAYGNTAMTMQNMTPAICAAITPNQWALVTDSRDNQQYHIAKLEDDRCWMQDNLDLNLNNATMANSLKGINESNPNTNATAAALNALNNGGGSGTNGLAENGLAYYSYANWTTPNSFTDPLVNRSGRCNPNINSSVPCVSPYQGTTESTTDGGYTNTKVIDTYSGSLITYNIGPGNYKIGTYYNFCAATAGSSCYSETYSSYSDSIYDICPLNWRLPRSGTVDYPATNYNEFGRLYDIIQANYSTTYATSTSPYSLQSMLSTPVSGNYNSGTAWGLGSFGSFWAPEYYSSDQIYRLLITGYSVEPQAHTARNGGRSIRCIAQN
ncbi:hypothetical protein IJI18_01800, partial [Candidatus Saccharibacteria bacterium]|nr:hypothetical protein [Candidatus Saccharibacteria bacterium]